jgi:hypothetical protein
MASSRPATLTPQPGAATPATFTALPSWKPPFAGDWIRAVGAALSNTIESFVGAELRPSALKVSMWVPSLS